MQARHAVEEVLPDRAINGVEEAVFYHGEEVARWRRYDSRLLLAHLARLDQKAEHLASVLPEAGFDAALERLEAGEPACLPQLADAADLACDEGWPEGEEEMPELEALLRQQEDEQGLER